MLHTRSLLDAPLAAIRGQGQSARMAKSRSICQGAQRVVSFISPRLRLFWQSSQSGPPVLICSVLFSEGRARRFATGRSPMERCRKHGGTGTSAQPKLHAAKGSPNSGSGALIWVLSATWFLTVPQGICKRGANRARSLIWNPYQAGRRGSINIGSFRRMNAQSAAIRESKQMAVSGPPLLSSSAAAVPLQSSNGRRHARTQKKELCCCVRPTSDRMLLSLPPPSSPPIHA
ncbi:hypothetical protein N431DRAFT_525971 [Stipitochalara longipes BDJ]|nr:hypothetical protein N431DRAFT_525971 [Stipitochalara longipes BDJ]